MPETTSNVEFAHRIHESGHHGGPHGRAEWLELVEAIVLAAVAVLTAWSGYQAARWDAASAAAYARSSQLTEEAQEQKTLAGQDHLYDVMALLSWVQATRAGDRDYAALLERRFRPEYEVAFQAWVKTDPLHNANAPFGPAFMPEFKSERLAKARELGQSAREQYERGVRSRETGDDYVRITVVLATVLLLTALSQRFRIHAARVGLVAVAFVMLAVAILWITTFPRA
ncbi:MAG TPA: hypothetical protein VMN82_04670 [Thermoanaerobaculia bacterium]|nr:hypothetical protein [Thermoanaerobaculia bacterium]